MKKKEGREHVWQKGVADLVILADFAIGITIDSWLIDQKTITLFLSRLSFFLRPCSSTTDGRVNTTWSENDKQMTERKTDDITKFQASASEGKVKNGSKVTTRIKQNRMLHHKQTRIGDIRQ